MAVGLRGQPSEFLEDFDSLNFSSGRRKWRLLGQEPRRIAAMAAFELAKNNALSIHRNPQGATIRPGRTARSQSGFPSAKDIPPRRRSRSPSSAWKSRPTGSGPRSTMPT